MDDDDYETEFYRMFLETLDVEEPLGRWGFHVYSTYSADMVVKYASSVPPSDGGEQEEKKEEDPQGPTVSGVQPSEAPSPFDKYVTTRFQQYLDSYINFTVPDPYDDLIWDGIDLDYVRLPNVSIAEARAHFHAHYVPEEGGGRKYKMFIVIDDGCLTSILDGPAPVFELKRRQSYDDATAGEQRVFVKVIDARYDEACEGIITKISARNATKGGPGGVTFYGWIKVTPRALLKLWMDMDAQGLKMLYDGPDKIFQDW